MKIDVRFVAYVNENEIPSEYTDFEYFEEVIFENIEDVFLGAGINSVNIEQINIEQKE